MEDNFGCNYAGANEADKRRDRWVFRWILTQLWRAQPIRDDQRHGWQRIPEQRFSWCSTCPTSSSPSPSWICSHARKSSIFGHLHEEVVDWNNVNWTLAALEDLELISITLTHVLWQMWLSIKPLANGSHILFNVLWILWFAELLTDEDAHVWGWLDEIHLGESKRETFMNKTELQQSP